jgi:hypothetical protein
MREPSMSALRGKADMPNEHAECPLMTQSGHFGTSRTRTGPGRSITRLFSDRMPKAITHEEALASLRVHDQLARARVDLRDVTEDREP